MEIENQFHSEIELLRTLDFETEPEINVICNLVQKTQDLNYISISGKSALHISARMNFLNSARILLEAGASVNVRSDRSYYHGTPLHFCCGLDEGIEMVRLLLRHGADVKAENKHKRTPLHLASICACVEIVQELLNSGADVNAIADPDFTPLIGALWHILPDCWQLGERHAYKVFVTIQALLRAGADVNYNSEIGGTALHWAAFKNFPHIIRFLLKNKADVNAKDRKGHTPLHDTVVSSDQPVETIRELIRGGAMVNALDLQERAALHCAVENCNIEATQELLRSGAHFNFVFFVQALDMLFLKKSERYRPATPKEFIEERSRNITALSKELIRYFFFNNPDSLEIVCQQLEADEKLFRLLRNCSIPECNLVDFKGSCATEADALSKMSCDCGQSNIWAICMGYQECYCDRNLAILKFLFSGQHSNFDYCFFYKLSKAFLLEVTLNQMSLCEFKDSGKQVLLNWPCVKEMERYVSFEDVAAFVQSQRFVMGASGLENVFSFTAGVSPCQINQ